MIKTQASSNGIPIDPRDQRIAELETQLRERDQLIATLQEKVQHLEEELKKTKRAGERQAAPFARKKRVAKPKRPGRKKGQGRFSYRRKPAPEQVKETKEAALDCCPGCGGSLTERKEHEQFVVDIPRPNSVRHTLDHWDSYPELAGVPGFDVEGWRYFLVGTNTLLARDTGFLCRILASQLLEFDLVIQWKNIEQDEIGWKSQ